MLPVYSLPEELVGGYQKFKDSLYATVHPLIKKVINEHKDELYVIYGNIALNTQGQRKIKGVYDNREKTIMKVWVGFTDIDESFRFLNEIPLYLLRFPPNTPSKSRYLHSIITYYLNEVYILSERLEAYTTKLSRLYKTNSYQKNFKEPFDKFNKEFRKIFAKVSPNTAV